MKDMFDDFFDGAWTVEGIKKYLDRVDKMEEFDNGKLDTSSVRQQDVDLARPGTRWHGAYHARRR